MIDLWLFAYEPFGKAGLGLLQKGQKLDQFNDIQVVLLIFVQTMKVQQMVVGSWSVFFNAVVHMVTKFQG